MDDDCCHGAIHDANFENDCCSIRTDNHREPSSNSNTLIGLA